LVVVVAGEVIVLMVVVPIVMEMVLVEQWRMIYLEVGVAWVFPSMAVMTVVVMVLYLVVLVVVVTIHHLVVLVVVVVVHHWVVLVVVVTIHR
jgi:hypothetical protein